MIVVALVVITHWHGHRIPGLRRLPMTGRILAFAILFGIIAGAGAVAHHLTQNGSPISTGRSYHISGAQLNATVQRDGSAHVGEDITYSFDGFYHGVYRDIPLRGDQAISTASVNVSVDGLQAQPDISCFVGSTYAPDGTFSVQQVPGGARVIICRTADSEDVPYHISYVVKNATTSYPNGTDVEYVAWGPSWTVPADNVTATLTLPEADGVKAWANPVWQDSTLRRVGHTLIAHADHLPPHSPFGIRAIEPAGAIDQPRHSGSVASVAQAEQAALADQRGEQRWADRLGGDRAYLYGLALGLLIGGLALLILWLAFGRDDDGGYHQEYEREPPPGVTPALGESLVAQEPVAGPAQFMATLLDLVRRKLLESETRPGKDGTTGLWVRVPDTEPQGLEEHETIVLDLLTHLAGADNAAQGGWIDVEHMSHTAEDSSRRAGIASKYSRFLDEVGDTTRRRGWFANTGRGIRAAIAFVGVLAVVILGVLWARSGPEHAGRTAQLQVAFLAATAATLLWLLIPRAAVVRRRSEAILLGRKAEAFKRFLTDFPRFKDAVAAKVELWEELLVWGVALGVAEHVIEAAKGMPIEILQASPMMANPTGLYFYGGGFGGFTPPPPPPSSSSSSSSGGGGFSGGGFGGGGGGAW